MYRVAKQACPEASADAIRLVVERTTQHMSIILQRENSRAVLRRLAPAETQSMETEALAQLHAGA